MKSALLIGNSDGIGLATTKKLLELDYQVVGISRRGSPVQHECYKHLVKDVSDGDFREFMGEAVGLFPKLDLVIYFAGIGNEKNIQDLRAETKVFEVNLMGAAICTELCLEKMLAQKSGHFIGLSSQADELTIPDAPSYCASKIAVSRYWESLGLAAQKSGVHVSNLRFGFVDTKMAKGDVHPGKISVAKSVSIIEQLIRRPRIRMTRPRRMIPLLWLAKLLTRLPVWFN